MAVPPIVPARLQVDPGGVEERGEAGDDGAVGDRGRAGGVGPDEVALDQVGWPNADVVARDQVALAVPGVAARPPIVLPSAWSKMAVPMAMAAEPAASCR